MSQLVSALPPLACPVGMGAMMLFMARGHRPSEPNREAEMAHLQAEIDRLRQDVARQPEKEKPEGVSP